MFRPVGAALVVAALAFGGAGAARAASDDDSAANRLVVEAAGLVERAEATEPPGDRAALYERAIDNLDAIVAQHPGSDLAVRLATGQAVGALDRRAIVRQWRLSSAEQCIADRDRLCVADLVLEMSKTVKDVKDGSGRSWAMMVAARGQAEVGAIMQALETANAIPKPSYRAWAYGAIAASMAVAQRDADIEDVFELALKAARTAQDGYSRSWALSAVAAWQAESGDASGALGVVRETLEIVNELKGPWERATVLATVAEAQHKAGETALGRRTLVDAQETASKIGEPASRFIAQSRIAWAQAEIEDIVGALQTTSHILNQGELILTSSRRYEVMEEIVSAVANTKYFTVASGIADEIKDHYWRAFAFADIAEAQLKFDDLVGASKSLDISFQSIRELERNSEIIEMLAILTTGIPSGERNN